MTVTEAEHQLLAALQHLQRQSQQQYFHSYVPYNLFAVACNIAGLQTQTPVALLTASQLSSARWEQLLHPNLCSIRAAQQAAALQQAVEESQYAVEAQTQTL